MTHSRLDQLYRRLLLTKFFTRGWGKPDNLKRLFAFRKILSNRETCQHLVAADYPIHIDKEYRDGDCHILEGHFTSPFVHHLPGIMPKEVETASFQVILPLHWRHPILKPVCIHLAGTGDHYFWRRRILTARPLLKEAGIASVLLENPYYGTRKPKHQLRSSLHNVSDLFVMGGALVLESLALLHWCEREGWGPLGLSGISMGGHMASLAATNWTKPITLAPCLSWSTASCVFTQGVMSGAIPWKTLQEQFFENSIYQDEIRKLIVSPEDKRKAYNMGQQFVKDYSQNIVHVESLHQQLQQQLQPLVVASDRKSTSSDISLTAKDVPHNVTIDSSKDRLFVDSSRKNDAKLGNLDSNFYPSGKDSLVMGASLTCEEYISRVKEPCSFKEKQPLSQLSPNNGVTESTLSAVSSGASSSNSFSSSPTQIFSQQQESVTLTAASSPVQQRSFISSAQPSTSSADKHAEQFMKGKASTKTQQGETTSGQINLETASLSLKYALSKARLTRSHPSSDDRMKDLQQEALDFMRGVMDECTHLGNFSIPVDPELIIIVSARQDAYVPKEGVIGLDQLWPGCEVRYVDQGHVGAVLFNQGIFRKAVVDAFERQIKKYHLEEPGWSHSAEPVR